MANLPARPISIGPGLVADFTMWTVCTLIADGPPTVLVPKGIATASANRQLGVTGNIPSQIGMDCAPALKFRRFVGPKSFTHEKIYPVGSFAALSSWRIKSQVTNLKT